MSSKILYKIFIFFLTISVVSCQKNGLEDLLNGAYPVSVKFVRSDSTAIIAGECINPYNSYFIEIAVDVKNESTNMTHIVKYTINDSVRQVSFLKGGKQYIPVNLIDGTNKVQINSTSLKDTLRARLQEFELVN